MGARAALGVAATAAAIKATLSTPLGAAAGPELERLGRSLTEKGQAAVATAHPLLNQAEARLQNLIQPQAAASTSSGSTPRTPSQAVPASSSSAGEPLLSDPAIRSNHVYTRPLVRKILREAAARHGVDPKLVLALSFWESGWDQSRVSETGAVGIMQVQPSTAQEAGPALLGRDIDIDDPYDNADVGVAVFREDLDNFKTPAMALAAYYQGPSSLRADGMLPDTQQYVEGILSLAGRMTP